MRINLPLPIWTTFQGHPTYVISCYWLHQNKTSRKQGKILNSYDAKSYDDLKNDFLTISVCPEETAAVKDDGQPFCDVT